MSKKNLTGSRIPIALGADLELVHQIGKEPLALLVMRVLSAWVLQLLQGASLLQSTSRIART